MGFFNFLFGGGGNFGNRSIPFETIDKIKREWETINVLLQGKTPAQLKQALIAADKTLDNALRDVVMGESMSERLKNARDIFDRQLYDDIWKAHKTRNNVVHESGYEPPHYVLTEAVANLKQGLKSLGVNL